jgi:uncharacterized membrane protein
MKKVIFVFIFVFFLALIAIISNAYIPVKPSEENLEVDLKMGETKVVDILIFNQNNYSVNISDVVISNYDCAFGCPGASLISYVKQIQANSTGIMSLKINSNIGDEPGLYSIPISYNASNNIEEISLEIQIKQNTNAYIICILPYVMIIIIALVVIFFIFRIKKLSQQKYKRY